MSKKISEDTRALILDTAWSLMADKRRLDVGMAEIAAAAGVTRQTVFYAFGNRAGLLVAMVRHRDTHSQHVPILRAMGTGEGADATTLATFVDAWLSYLPEIYPVGIQLESAALSDADAAQAWNDRFVDHGVRLGLVNILVRMVAAGTLASTINPQRAADACLSLLVPSAWRLLVVERGWSPKEFAQSRRQLIAAAIGLAVWKAE